MLLTNIDLTGPQLIKPISSRYRCFRNAQTVGCCPADLRVIPPFLMGFSRRIQAAVFSFIAGVIPPMPMLGRSLL